MESIYIGKKDLSRYISACFVGLSKSDDIAIIARGNNVKKAIDVLAILIREHIQTPKYNIVVDSEEYTDKETNTTRNVSTIEIALSGVIKVKKDK